MRHQAPKQHLQLQPTPVPDSTLHMIKSPLEEPHDVLRLPAVLHCCVQALLDQLVVEEGHGQTTQAAGRLTHIVTVKVLLKQLGGGGEEWGEQWGRVR